MSEPNKVDVIAKIMLILQQDCADPVETLIAEAEAMLKVAKALRGMSGPEARATIRAVASLVGAA